MVHFIANPILKVRKLRLGKGMAPNHGPEKELDPDALAPRPKRDPPRLHGPWATAAPSGPEAPAVLTLRLRLLCVPHSQGSGFGLLFVSPYGSVELLVVNWTGDRGGACQT